MSSGRAVRDGTGRLAAIVPESLWARAWAVRQRYHGAAIRFDRPLNTLPVSLTGPHCALDCAHCGGHYLRHMRSIDEVDAPQASSLLISGGCDIAGRVPVEAHLSRVAALREGRRLNWHLGLTDEVTIRLIAPYVDLVSFDVVGDRDTAREVYGLDADLGRYMATLDMLRRHTRVVPHLTLGLRAGRLSGEWAALGALAERRVESLVLLVLIPTPGTRYADCEPPDLNSVARFLLYARVALPESKLYLGCMRPRGSYRTALDDLAVRAGLNVIVNPARSALSRAEELGLETTWGDECCALD